MAKDNIHAKHRDRLRQQFLDGEENALNDIQLLEMLLFYAIPRKDTNPIAHRLMSEYGSLSGVLDAAYEDILDVEGIGEISAALLKTVPEIARRYMLDKMGIHP